MPETTCRGRRAWAIENGSLRLTVTIEGGHVAEVLHKASGVNPLWTPPWPSIEPSTYDAERHPEYGSGPEAKLLAGILGHNLCLDLFGGPSPGEAETGMTVHGESSVLPYALAEESGELVMRARFPQAQLGFERRLMLAGDVTVIHETVENLTACDRPSAWTQHVTMGPPFIEPGVTRFVAPATRSKVYETDFTEGKGQQQTGAEFDWPHCPRKDGGSIDLRVYPSVPVSAGYTVSLMDPAREHAWFASWNPKLRLAFGYAWMRADFPWLGRWEENHSRTHAPWNGQAVTCGMEFGASPMPETRRAMIERGSLFGVSGYRWFEAGRKVTARYCVFARAAERMPESVQWDGGSTVTLEG